MTVSIKVGAELDAAQLEAQLNQLTQRINNTGAAIAKAGNQRFDPIPRATLEMLQRVESTMRNISRLAPDLAKRINASGQQGASFDQLDFTKLYTEQAQRQRAQRGLFQMTTGLGFGAMPVTPPSTPPPLSPGIQPTPMRPGPNIAPGRGPGSAAADVFQQALQAAGPMGGIAARGIGAGRAAARAAGIGAGIASGVGAGLGFAAIQGITALISGVRQHVGAAQQESIGYADLYRSIGGRTSGNSFDGLRRSLRGASDTVGVTYEEAQNLAGIAARRSYVSDARQLAGDVELGGGFARSFGFDPSQGVSAFSGMRGIGITRSTDEGRRLGLQIAEGIAAAGVFGKAEDYLAEIASYGEQTTRATLTRANVEGYNAAMAGLMRGGPVGMDVRGAANILNQADASIRRGGAAGEAGQAFMYQAIGRRLGLDPLMTEVMQEGGAFATGRNTFGPGSIAGEYYRSNGMPVPEGAAGDDTTALELVTQGLRSRYGGGNRRLMANAASNLLGVNQRQAMALMALRPEQITGMRGLVSDERLSGLSATGIQTMGRVAVADRPELERIGDEFAGRTGTDRLTAAERQALTQAREGANVAELRRVVAEIASSRQAEETEGDRTRRTLQGIDKTLQDLATALVTPLNMARDALLVLAGRDGRALTPRELAGRIRDSELAAADDERNAALAALEPDRAAAADRYARAVGLANNNPTDPALDAAATNAREALAAVEERRAAILREHAQRRAGAQRTHDGTIGAYRAQQHALSGQGDAPISTPETVRNRAQEFSDLLMRHGGDILRPHHATGIAANAIQESGMRTNAVGDGGRSAGLIQWNGARRTAFRVMFGKDPTEATMEEQARFVVWELKNTERSALERIQATNTPEAAAAATSRFYERPRDVEAEARRRAAIAAGLSPPTAAMPVPAPGGVLGDLQRTPMPAGADAAAAAGGGGDVRLYAGVEGRFTLETPQGQQAAPPINIRTDFMRARPYGARQ